MTLRVIAIDGPAASGKSSTGGLVARRLGWAHLDSGALYRALTLAALDSLGEEGAGSGERWPAQRIVALADALPVRLVLVGDVFRPEVAGVDVEAAIRGERVTRHVSAVAAVADVRTWVNAQQRRAVREAEGRGVVVDGRDIGTVVFPDAELKIFLDATPEERARRRYQQQSLQGVPSSLAKTRREVEERDRRDSSREASPLRQAPDAIYLDSTALTVEEVVDVIVRLWEKERSRA